MRVGAIPAAHSSLGWAHLFTGRPWDHDTRQYQFRYRWYDPHQCRFTSLDPLGYAGGIEQYAYCAWNPVHFADPMGLAAEYQFGGAWGERLADRLDASLNGLGSGALAGDEHWIWNGSVGTLADLGRGTADLLRFGRGLAEDQIGYSSTTGRKLTDLERSEAFWGDVGRGWGIVLTIGGPGKPGARAAPTRTHRPALYSARRRGSAQAFDPDNINRTGRPTQNILATGGHSPQPKGGVYVLRNRVTGRPMRCGRTKDLQRRRAEHRRDPRTRALDFEEAHRTDDYARQRSLEQLMHDRLKPPLDRINPISPRNSRRSEYLRAAEDILKGPEP